MRDDLLPLLAIAAVGLSCFFPMFIIGLRYRWARRKKFEDMERMWSMWEFESNLKYTLRQLKKIRKEIHRNDTVRRSLQKSRRKAR